MLLALIFRVVWLLIRPGNVVCNGGTQSTQCHVSLQMNVLMKPINSGEREKQVFKAVLIPREWSRHFHGENA